MRRLTEREPAADVLPQGPEADDVDTWEDVARLTPGAE
jgi:CTP:molybdopterin cytidylyltransferase MocA